MKKNALLYKIIFYVLLLGISYYVFLPAINIHSLSAWMFVLVFGSLAWILFQKKSTIKVAKGKTFVDVPQTKPLAIGIGVLMACLVLSGLIFSPFFFSKSYANRIVVEQVEFDEIPEYSFRQTAIIDRTSAELLGDKVMGQMSDLVSQFRVSSEYSQISYQNETVRVTPVAYDGFIKYLRNRENGIPGYIIVNTTSGNTRLVRNGMNMRYVPSAYFNDNLYRKLRFQYPTVMFHSPTFEIDEEGNPYYVCTTYGYTGIHSKEYVTGVILFNPVDGTSARYDCNNVPSWVDRIYPEALIDKELNDYGAYQNGFWNSLIGQQGVKKTSQGYNYISKDGDIWLYTGMTSAASDDSNLGFMLVNLRTHEAQYIATPGASEYAVMASAEGEVLNYGYTATFPTLINVANKPIYLLSLKDSAGLIKMYAMVDAQDYQQVYTIKADKNTETAIADLIQQVSGERIETADVLEKTIVIQQMRTVTISGNTYIYLMDEEGEMYYTRVTEENAKEVLFLQEQDTLHILYTKSSNGNQIAKIKTNS